jgi:hypothetical protein
MGESNDDLYQSVGRVEGKLDSLIDMVRQHIEDDKEVVKRVNSLERWRAVMLAMGAVAGGAAGKISAFFGGS